jgi:hypothetical protein
VRFSRIGSYRKSNNGNYYRHSELSERTESSFIHLFIFSFKFLLLWSIPRSVDCREATTIVKFKEKTKKMSFLSSRNDLITLSPPIQRERYILCMLVSMCQHRPPKPPKTQYFGPTDIACLPGPKIDRNFRNFVINKKNKYLFYFL